MHTRRVLLRVLPAPSQHRLSVSDVVLCASTARKPPVFFPGKLDVNDSDSSVVDSGAESDSGTWDDTDVNVGCHGLVSELRKYEGDEARFTPDQ